MSARFPWIFTVLLLFAAIFLGFLYSPFLTQPVSVNIGSLDDGPYVQQGFYSRENASDAPYRWSGGEATLFFPNRGHIPFTISLAADAPRPEGQSQPDISLVANGQVIGQFVAEPGIRDYSFSYTPASLWPSDLLLQLNATTFLPPGDPRELGLLVNGVRLEPAPSPSMLRHILFVLVSVLPGLLLIAATYLMLCLGRVSRTVTVAGTLLLLSVIAWGVYRGTVSMALIVPLAVVVLLACVTMWLLGLPRMQARVKVETATVFTRLGRWSGRTYARTFSREFIRYLGLSAVSWLRAYRWDVVIAVVLFAFALAVRLPYYLDMPHITDEFREVQIATDVARGSYYPLFYSTTDYLGVVHSYLLGFVLRVAGLSIYAPRLYMVALGALTVSLTYWLAREITTRRTAIIVAGLMLFSPMHILVESHVAWMNSTTPVWTVLMFITFYRGVASNKDVSLILSGLFAAIALQTHPIVALFFPGMMVWYIVEQRRQDRPVGEWTRHPALYVALLAFLAGYGNIIYYNSHGRNYALAAAQRRDAMENNPLNLFVYSRSLENMLQNLLSTLSGTFDFEYSARAFLRPAMLFYGSWLALGIGYAIKKRILFVLLPLVSALLLLPFVNQNWTIPDKSRYLAPLLPLCYIAMSMFALSVWTSLRPKDSSRTRASHRFGPILSGLVCFVLVSYPLLPLWDFYQTHGNSEWSNRSFLILTERLRSYRDRAIPIYVDAEIREDDLPIVGSNPMKALEYLLFLDGTDCRVVWFEPEGDPPRTFDHEVEYLPPSELEAPSVWVLAPESQRELSDRYGGALVDVSGPDWNDARFGLYELVGDGS